VHKRFITEVKRFEFVIDRMSSHIKLRGRWCHIIFLMFLSEMGMKLMM
jgi:hypothetical protein